MAPLEAPPPVHISCLLPQQQSLRFQFHIFISIITGVNGNTIDSSTAEPGKPDLCIIKKLSYCVTTIPSGTLPSPDKVSLAGCVLIFPHQEEADVMFNTAFVFELGVLKRLAEPLLQDVPPNAPEFSEAKRLLKFLSYLKCIDKNEILSTSILREFLDSNNFHY